MKKRLNPYLVGAIGLLIMLVFYYSLLALVTGDPLHPFYFFRDKWLLLTLLFLSFSSQMFFHQKLKIQSDKINKGAMGASSGASGVAMAACCAHHLADIFPILGIAGTAAFLTNYQDHFIGAGIIINVIGTLYILVKIKKHSDHCSIQDT